MQNKNVTIVSYVDVALSMADSEIETLVGDGLISIS